MTLLLQITGALAALTGLSAVFLAWRQKGPRLGAWRFALPAGWILLTLGLVLWGRSTHADQGLALGSVLVMSLAMAVLAWQGLRLWRSPARAQPSRRGDSDTLSLGRGYWGRFAIRFISSAAIAPAFGAATGLAGYAFIPGAEADRLTGMAVVSLTALASAWVVQLASRRPYRACLGLTLATGLAAALVFLPRIL